MIDSKIWEWTNDLGGIASLASLAISVYVAFSVRNIKRFYQFTALAPKRLRALKGHHSSINRFLEDFPTTRSQIEQEFAQCVPILRSVRSKVGRQHKKSIGKLIRLLETPRVLEAPLAADVERLDIEYTNKRLLMIHDELRYLSEDSRLEM